MIAGIAAAQSLDKLIGSRFHVGEVAAQGTGAVEDQHDEGTAIFLNDFSII